MSRGPVATHSGEKKGKHGDGEMMDVRQFEYFIGRDLGLHLYCRSEVVGNVGYPYLLERPSL